MLDRITSRFSGGRTYMTIILMIITVILGIIEVGGTVILSPEVTAGLVTFLGTVAAYFRGKATV